MKKILPALVTLVSLTSSTFVSAAVNEDFSTLSESFWSLSSTTTGSDAAPLPYAAGGFLKLVTDPSGADSGTQTLKIVSTAADSSLTFMGDQSLSFEVTNLYLSQYGGSSTQAWPNLQLGLGTSTGLLTSQAAGVYFQINGPTGASTLVLRGDGGANTQLWSGTSLSYDSIAVTITSSTWSYVIDDGTTTYSDSGTHSAASNASWTGSTGLYSQVYLNANTIRDWVTDVSVDSFSASSIPEHSSVSAIIGLMALGMIVSCRARK